MKRRQILPAASQQVLQRRHLGLALLLIAAFCGCQTQDSRTRVVQRQLLTRLPETYMNGSFGIARDGIHYAYAERSPDLSRVIRNGQPDPAYADVSLPTVAWGSGETVYWAKEKPDSPFLLLVGPEGSLETELRRIAPIIFSKNGKRWATAGMTMNEADGGVTFGPAVVYSNGRLIGHFADATLPALSPDGEHMAFIAERDDGKKALIVDGTERKVFDTPGLDKAAPVAKSSGSGQLGLSQFRVLYDEEGTLITLAHDSDGWAVFRGNDRMGSFSHSLDSSADMNLTVDTLRNGSAILANSLVLGSQRTLLWWERPAGETEVWRVARNGKPQPFECATYFTPFPPVLSEDARRIAYPCYRETLVKPNPLVDIVIDDQRLGPFVGIWGIAFSADARRLAFAAATERNRWRYSIDGHYFPMIWDAVWRARFSPDGRHVAWEAEHGKRSVLVLDGDSIFSYDDVLWGPEFPQPDRVAWIVRRGRNVFRVDVTF